MEDITKGERVREYKILGMRNHEWTHIAKGTSIGHKRIELVNGKYEAVKLEIVNPEGNFFITKLACYP